MGVTVREHPKGSGRWCIFIHKGSFRKNKYIPPLGNKSSRQRALEAAARVELAIDLYGLHGAIKILQGGTEDQIQTPTVSEYSAKWKRLLEKADIKPSTRKMYLSNLDHHIVPALGKYLMTEIDYPQLRDFIASKVSATYSSGRFRKSGTGYEPADERTYSRNTVRIMAMTLRAMFAEAVREKLIPSNPVAGLAQLYRRKKSDREVKRNQVYTLDELYAIEDVLAKHRNLFGEDYEFSLVLSRTGMRIGEAVGLMAEDIDYRSGTIEVRRNIPSGIGEVEESTKTHHSNRVIDMGADLPVILKAMQARRLKERLASGPRAKSSPWLFHAPGGGHYDYHRFRQNWARAQKMASIRYRSPHSLRHTYASQMLASGVDIAYVAKQLGHSSPAVTLAIYAHFIPDRRPGEANVMDRIRKEKSGKETEA